MKKLANLNRLELKCARRVSQPSQRRTGYGSGVYDEAKIRLVLGIIGLIMLVSAGGMFLSGLGPPPGSSVILPVIITLVVIGIILLAIATEGSICI